MKKKIFLLIKYTSKIFNISRKNSANLLLTIFLNNHLFDLKDKQQKIILENLVTYFQKLVFGVDALGLNKNKRNKHLTDDEILNHLDNKVNDLICCVKHIKFYN